MTDLCECGEPLTEKPIGQRTAYCAECIWKSNNHKLKRVSRQFGWLWNVGIKAPDDG